MCACFFPLLNSSRLNLIRGMLCGEGPAVQSLYTHSPSRQRVLGPSLSLTTTPPSPKRPFITTHSAPVPSSLEEDLPDSEWTCSSLIPSLPHSLTPSPPHPLTPSLPPLPSPLTPLPHHSLTLSLPHSLNLSPLTPLPLPLHSHTLTPQTGRKGPPPPDAHSTLTTPIKPSLLTNLMSKQVGRVLYYDN